MSKAPCEILAPAGSRESLAAALAAGAEAVYFGLDEGFNARARAANFRLDGLEETVLQIHRAGARAYLALNTLVFQSELPKLGEVLQRVAESGVDAIIVQDPGLCLMARAICPELEIHASTQMTISSPEASKFAETLGVTRVVVPRELSVEEIRKFRAGTELELEVFIMGALCVSWSGQCLSSEAWGGRSANRGKCAQACRLPYDLVVDGETRDLGAVKYLLSPQDLAGFRAVEQLLEIGIHTLKIEGRQKAPSFVHQAVTSLREWRDSIQGGRASVQALSENLRDLSLVYSRGLGDGFLAGSDHQTLVEGLTPRHKGLLLGTVSGVKGKRVTVDQASSVENSAIGEVSSPLAACGGSTKSATGAVIAEVEPRAGMGVVFQQGDEQDKEQGGPIFDVRKTSTGWCLGFGKPGPDLRRVKAGAQVYVTSDPKLTIKKSPEAQGRLPLRIQVEASLDENLRITGSWGDDSVSLESTVPLQEARNHALDKAVLQENLGALGGTPFRLEVLEYQGPDNLFLPLAQLRNLRRRLVEELEERVRRTSLRTLHRDFSLDNFLGRGVKRSAGSPYLVALCRNEEQLQAAIDCGVQEVELDWMELVGLNAVVAKAREAGLKVGLATVRIQKPEESAYDRRIEKLNPDAVLIRHWAGMMHFLEAQDKPELHGDFSLNVTNSITFHHLVKMGFDTLTASHDLDEKQLFHLLAEVDPKRLAVTVHHHIPTFHTEHCVYSALLSQGRDYRTCGRPCEKHQVSLRDRVNLEHPVIVDVGCRNTVFNAQAQSAAFLVPKLVEAGVERLRVEFVRERFDESRVVLEAYQSLLRGESSSAQIVERIGAHEQFGVTKGTMEVLQ